MKIILCDDQQIAFQELQPLIKSFSEKYQIKIDFQYFTKPSLLFLHLQKEPADILFMDLEFCNAAEDGILWLKKIKQQYPNIIVIILTAYEKRYKEGFEARAFRFMTKPIEEEELYNYLQVSLEELELTKTISLTKRGIPHTIFIRDICYFSAQSGGSELWTRSNMYYCDESLHQWEQQLPNTAFFRCHSKYLVNLTHVTTFDHHVLTLVNGEKVPVSRRKWKAFQLAYMQFDAKKGH